VAFEPSKLEFREKSHRYFYDGQPVPGVTTVLGIISKGDALTRWAANCAVDYLTPRLQGEVSTDDLAVLLHEARSAYDDVKEEAGTIGTLAHNWIEQHLRGFNEPLPTNEFARNSCEAALKWLRDNEWETIDVEKRIFSPTHLYAGTRDWYVRIHGRLAIADWKTSKAIYGSYWYQTAAYLRAEEESSGVEIPDRWVIRIDKFTGEVEDQYEPPETIEPDFQAFLAAKTLYKRELERKRKRK
jgi:hypothetical protein